MYSDYSDIIQVAEDWQANIDNCRNVLDRVYLELESIKEFPENFDADYVGHIINTLKRAIYYVDPASVKM